MAGKNPHPAIVLLAESGTPLRVRDFAAHGINRMTLHRLAEQNEIERIGNGFFRLPNKAGMYDDWAVVSVRYPEAVIATLSAAVFHGSTQEMPGSIYVALPRASGRSTLANSFPVMTKVLRWSVSGADDPFSYGIKSHVIDGVAVKVTDPERTLVDMFRYSPFNPSARDAAMHVSEESFMDCMQRTLGRPDVSLDKVQAYAERLGVLKALSPLLKNAVFSMSSSVSDGFVP